MTLNFWTFLFTFLWLVTAIHGAYTTYNQTQFLGYWNSQIEQSRHPSAVTDLNDHAVSLYRDYFNYDEFHKYLSYKISLDLMNKDHDEKLEEALEETLIGEGKQPHKSQGIERLQQGLKGLLNEELLPTLVFNLQKRIKESGPIQINLNFTSQVSPEFHFKRELASNNTIHWDNKGELYKKLTQEPLPLHQHIFETPLPAQTHFYQYHGGQISLWYHPTKKKGFIRFRRYFRSPDLAKAKSFLKEEDFRVNLVHFKGLETKEPGAYGNGHFITADVYQSFSEEKAKPQMERAEIFFGQLLPTHFHQHNLVELPFGYNEDVISSDALNLHGVLKHDEKEVMFTTQVEKLVYDFKQKEFTSQSKLRSEVKSNDKERELPTGELHQKIYHTLLKRNVINLIDGLQLQSIYGDLGEKS